MAVSPFNQVWAQEKRAMVIRRRALKEWTCSSRDASNEVISRGCRRAEAEQHIVPSRPNVTRHAFLWSCTRQAQAFALPAGTTGAHKARWLSPRLEESAMQSFRLLYETRSMTYSEHSWTCPRTARSCVGWSLDLPAASIEMLYPHEGRTSSKLCMSSPDPLNGVTGAWLGLLRRIALQWESTLQQSHAIERTAAPPPLNLAPLTVLPVSV
jgi:hypothetical protein